MRARLARLVAIIVMVTPGIMLVPASRALADGPQPFFKIDGRFSDSYDASMDSTTLPEPVDEYPGSPLVGQPVHFAVDLSLLMPGEGVDLRRATFRIDTGDGHSYPASSVTHTYTRPGSYIVRVNSPEDVAGTGAGEIDSVLVNVAPESGYRLTTGAISVNGKLIDPNATSTPTFDPRHPLRFEGGVAGQGSAPVARWEWDFGDGSSGSGPVLTHTYGAGVVSDQYLFVTLRATDANGLFTDTMIDLAPSTHPKSGFAIPALVSGASARRAAAGQTDLAGWFRSFYVSVTSGLRTSIERLGSGQDRLSSRVVALILALAVFLGALHSLTPGHSKSIMAAILVGKSDSKTRDVFALASAITFTHTIVIYVLGFVLLAFARTVWLSQLMPYFSRLNAVLIVALGGWLISRGVRAGLARRAQVRREHLHAEAHEHGHDHEHSHGHYHNYQVGGSWWSMMAAGAAGGLVPCIDALSILLVAASVHMVGFGLVVVLFFSLGLAASIIALGLLVIRTKEVLKIEERLGERIATYAPLLTGLLVLFLGLPLLFAH